jgi:hypothetical protein
VRGRSCSTTWRRICRAGGRLRPRIIKTSDYRIGDGGTWVYLQLLTEESRPTGTARRSAGLRRKRNERRHAFAGRVLKAKGKGGEAPATEAAPEAPATPEANAGGEASA